VLSSDEKILEAIEGQGLIGSVTIGLTWMVQEHDADLSFIAEMIRGTVTKIENYNPTGALNANIVGDEVIISWDFQPKAETWIIAADEIPYWTKLRTMIDHQRHQGQVFVNKDWFEIDENNSRLLAEYIQTKAKSLGYTQAESELHVDAESGSISFIWRMWR
jgi:hypothetical protein